MSRTDKDAPYRYGGSRHRYWTTTDGHAQFTRQCRRRVRRAATMSLRAGIEPAPKTTVGYEYWD